jgi:hypothetical protein
MDKRRLPTSLVLVALLQAVSVLVLPPDLYAQIDLWVWLVAVALFGLLGLNLLRLRDWSRVASVFVQGFNIIVRLLTLLSNTVPRGAEGADMAFLMTSLLSMFLSGVVLYYIEKPDIQLVMQR